jgi:hypothetical protein
MHFKKKKFSTLYEIPGMNNLETRVTLDTRHETRQTKEEEEKKM